MTALPRLSANVAVNRVALGATEYTMRPLRYNSTFATVPSESEAPNATYASLEEGYETVAVTTGALLAAGGSYVSWKVLTVPAQELSNAPTEIVEFCVMTICNDDVIPEETSAPLFLNS